MQGWGDGVRRLGKVPSEVDTELPPEQRARRKPCWPLGIVLERRSSACRGPVFSLAWPVRRTARRGNHGPGSQRFLQSGLFLWHPEVPCFCHHTACQRGPEEAAPSREGQGQVRSPPTGLRGLQVPLHWLARLSCSPVLVAAQQNTLRLEGTPGPQLRARSEPPRNYSCKTRRGGAGLSPCL